jgi:hypothetical protein
LGRDKRENVENIQRHDTEKIRMGLQAKLGREIRLLQLRFKKSAPTDYDKKKIWEKALKEKDAMKDVVSESLREAWFVPLKDTLKGIQTTRSHSSVWDKANQNSNAGSNSDSNFLSPATSRQSSNSSGTSRLGGTRESDTRPKAVSFNDSIEYSSPHLDTLTLTLTPPNNSS